MGDEDGYFGERVAATYDEESAEMFAPAAVDPAVDLLAGLAGGGRALELGIGTGRIALAAGAARRRGRMASTCRGRWSRGCAPSRAATAIGVTIGDFAATRVDGTFALAYLVFNTIMNLTTQEAQVACFRNVAAHLEPGGCFVIEVHVPELRRLPPGQNVRAVPREPGAVGVRRLRHRHAGDELELLEVADGRGEYTSIPFRYVWPAELDLMAQLAGLRLRDAVGRVDAGAVHQREPPARLDLGEAHRLAGAAPGAGPRSHRMVPLAGAPAAQRPRALPQVGRWPGTACSSRPCWRSDAVQTSPPSGTHRRRHP